MALGLEPCAAKAFALVHNHSIIYQVCEAHDGRRRHAETDCIGQECLVAPSMGPDACLLLVDPSEECVDRYIGPQKAQVTDVEGALVCGAAWRAVGRLVGFSV